MMVVFIVSRNAVLSHFENVTGKTSSLPSGGGGRRPLLFEFNFALAGPAGTFKLFT